VRISIGLPSDNAVARQAVAELLRQCAPADSVENGPKGSLVI
jgi:hypothetical protein